MIINMKQRGFKIPVLKSLFNLRGYIGDAIMSIFDIVGPIMVGPSSSHTAGAVRIGLVARRLLGEEIKSAQILLYGSFLATGKGHGTDKALVAGLLGMKPDDYRIPHSMEIAADRGIDIEFGEAHLKEAHPNTAQIRLTGETGKTLEVIGESLGGSRINIAQIDGIETNFPEIVRHLLFITWTSRDMYRKLHLCWRTNPSMLRQCSYTGRPEADVPLWLWSAIRKFLRTVLSG